MGKKRTLRFEFDWDSFFEIHEENFDPQEHEFEGCCGALEFYGFPEVATTYKTFVWEWKNSVDEQQDEAGLYGHKLTETEYPTEAVFKKKQLEFFEKELHREPAELKYYGVFLIVLIKSQLFLKPMLLKQGFKLVSDKGVNPKTRNTLYVFIKEAKK